MENKKNNNKDYSSYAQRYHKIVGFVYFTQVWNIFCFSYSTYSNNKKD